MTDQPISEGIVHGVIEELELPPEPRLGPAALAAAVQRRAPLYDKGQESH